MKKVIFQLFHGDNKLLFSEMLIRYATLYILDQRSYMNFKIHCNNSTQIDISLHMDILSWFSAKQVWFLFLNFECFNSWEASNINLIDFGLIRQGLKPTIYHTQGEHAKYYTTYVV